MKWYFPSWNGDFRLESRDGNAVLVVEKATAAEREMLARFGAYAVKRKWTDLAPAALIEDGEYGLRAPVGAVGVQILRFLRPRKATLTALRHIGGRVEISSAGEDIIESSPSIDAAVTSEGSAAIGVDEVKVVSVSRPTPSCPDCVPGSIDRASEVLLSFLTDAQHEQWARQRVIVVEGQITHRRYLIAHRHSPIAAHNRRICADLDGGHILHFHDWTVPPEEEVLAAKLILEHAEPWLRNEATVLGPYFRFKNPFGDVSDGIGDTGLTTAIGLLAQGVLRTR